MSTKKISIPPARDARLRRLAKRIARYLFTYDDGGGGVRAHRLVTEIDPDGCTPTKLCSGWGERTMADRILDHLRRDELAAMRKERP